MITGTVPVKVPEKLSELELDAGGKKIDSLGLGDTLDDAMRRSEKTVRYTNAEAQAQAAALIVIHSAIAAAHHVKTTDAGEIVSGTFPVARGGTGLSTIALGGILYASALDVLSRLAPTAANQVLRSTAANVLQFAALLAADIPNLPASKITSEQFPLARMPRAAAGLFLEGNGAADPIYNALIAANIPNLDAAKITTGVLLLARIPNMDWAHISGLFPRTIADLLSDHNLANHVLGTIVPHDALVSLTEKAHGSLTGIGAADHHTKYTDVEALAAAKAGAGVLEGDLVQLDAVGLPAVDGSQLTGLPAGYTDEEAQATVKANVEVGDLKAPTGPLAMNNQNITGVASLTATELHGTTYWGDVYFEDVECPICHLKFKKGDKIIFMVNVVEEKHISAFPVHLGCSAG